MENTNDQIAAWAFGAVEHYSPIDFDRLRSFDAVFVTMHKVKTVAIEDRWMGTAHKLCDAGVKVVLFQEAETGWALERPWDEQKDFFELLGKVDLFLTHNQRDVALWGELRKGKSTFRWRTCLDLGTVSAAAISPHTKITRPLLAGSSFDMRANGITGLIACKVFPNSLIHQNRNTWYDGRNDDMQRMFGPFEDIPEQGWLSWAKAISPAYIAVHPMPAAAAGRDQLAFAALGIPCVGNEELDIQRELFPELAVNCFDVVSIRRAVYRLLHSYEYYMETRACAMDKLKQYGIEAAKVQADEIKHAAGLT